MDNDFMPAKQCYTAAYRLSQSHVVPLSQRGMPTFGTGLVDGLSGRQSA